MYTRADVTTEMLSRIPLFDGLEPEQIESLVRMLRFRTVPAGKDIMTSEQLGEAVYFVLAGTLKVHVEQPDGRDVVLALLGAGQIVGEMSVVDNVGRSASVLTLEDCQLLWMDRTAFLDCLNTMPAMCMNLIRMFSRRLRRADAHIAALVTLDVHGRVARQVLALANEYGQETPDGNIHIPLSLTQSDLADIVGASRVRVNQVLGDFRQRGYISIDQSHHVTIHDPEGLNRRIR